MSNQAKIIQIFSIQMVGQYSNGGLNTGVNLVGYSNDIQTLDHLAIEQLLII